MINSTLNISVNVFERKEPPLEKEIPKNLTGLELLNFCEFSLHLPCKQDYIILIKRAEFDYKIASSEKDLSEYKYNPIEILLYPPTFLINVHCPDKRIKLTQFKSTLTCEEIVKKLCEDQFHLTNYLAYALYQTSDTRTDPLNSKAAVIELLPNVKDLYLLRRFWFSTALNIQRENDLHYAFSQAKEEFFRSQFQYNCVDAVSMAALLLLLDFDCKPDLVKKMFKKMKSKEQKEHLPKYFFTNKKLIDSVMHKLAEFQTIDVVKAKQTFLNKAMEFPYFSQPLFDCIYPSKDGVETQGKMVFGEECIAFVKNLNDFSIDNSIPYNVIRQWKQLDDDRTKVRIVYVTETQQFAQFVITSKTPFKIITYLLNVMQFLKQMKLLMQKKEDSRARTSRRGTVRNMNAVADESNLMNSKFFISLPRVQAPDSFITENIQPRRVQLTVPPPPPTPTAKSLSILGSEIDRGLAKEVYKLINDTLSHESLTPIDDTRALIARYTTVTPTFDRLLGESDGDFSSTVQTVATALVMLAISVLNPIDAFQCLYFMYTALARFAAERWREFHFVDHARDISPLFEQVVNAVTQHGYAKITHPMAYAVVGAIDTAEARGLLHLIDCVSMVLQQCVASSARAFAAAQIGGAEVNAALHGDPVVPLFDPVRAEALLSSLRPLIAEDGVHAAQELQKLPHSQRIDTHKIADAFGALDALVQFLRSPPALFLLSQALRTFSAGDFPETLEGAATAFVAAQESAFVLWTANAANNAERATRITQTAATFLRLFLDGSPAARDQHRILGVLLTREMSSDRLETFLAPGDPLHSVALELLKARGDPQAVLALLAVDARTGKQRRALFLSAIDELDRCLRAGKLRPEDGLSVASSFESITFAALSAASADPDCGRLKQELLRIGLLLDPFSKGKADANRESVEDIRKHLRALRFLANGESDAVRIFVDLTEPSALSFFVEPPDISEQKELLRGLQGKLARFGARRASRRVIV